MAEEPENLTLLLLREIRAKQDEHTERFERVDKRLQHVEKQLDHFGKLVTYSLGQSSETSFRQTQQQSSIDELFEKLEKLLAEKET